MPLEFANSSFSTLKILATVKQICLNIPLFNRFSTLKILATVKLHPTQKPVALVLVPLRF